MLLHSKSPSQFRRLGLYTRSAHRLLGRTAPIPMFHSCSSLACYGETAKAYLLLDGHTHWRCVVSEQAVFPDVVLNDCPFQILFCSPLCPFVVFIWSYYHAGGKALRF
jgi:hypothetical protein